MEIQRAINLFLHLKMKKEMSGSLFIKSILKKKNDLKIN